MEHFTRCDRLRQTASDCVRLRQTEQTGEIRPNGALYVICPIASGCAGWGRGAKRLRQNARGRLMEKCLSWI